MQRIRFVDIRTFVFDNEVLFEGFEELLVRQAVQIFHHAVIIDDIELIIREAYG